MATTDDHPIRITAADYKPVGQGNLETWLNKEAEAAKGGVKPEDNEEVSTAAYGELYEPPKGAKKPVVDPSSELYPQVSSEYAVSQAARREAVGNAFASTSAASKAGQALLQANFEHAKPGGFVSHSPLLQGQRAQGKVASFLTDQLGRVGLR
jgi:hypothetical protein